jgi:hypothetical protein
MGAPQGAPMHRRDADDGVLRFGAVEFEIVSAIVNVAVIAVGHSIRDAPRLNKTYGKGRWRKLKGRASVRLPSGRIRVAELHWYEAHGIGKRDFKVKRYLD